MLRLAAYWLLFSVPVALLAGRIVHATNRDLIAEIEEYLRRRRRRSVRRAMGVVVGFTGIGVAIAMTAPGGSRLPDVRAVTGWAFDAGVDGSTGTVPSGDGASHPASTPDRQVAAPPSAPDGSPGRAAESTSAEVGAPAAGEEGADEYGFVAPSNGQPAPVDEVDAPWPGAPSRVPSDDAPSRKPPAAATTSTTRPDPAEPDDEPEPTTTTTTTPPAPPPGTSTTTTTPTTVPPEDPPPDATTTTTTTPPEQTEPAEAPN